MKFKDISSLISNFFHFKKFILILVFSIVTLIGNCQSTSTLDIISPSENCLGDTSSFAINTNLLIEQIIEWDFGDTASGANNTSTLGLPTHIYSAPGTYTVSCILQVNCGGPVNISNPIGVPCFYIDTIYTTLTVINCDTSSNNSFLEINYSSANCLDDSVSFSLHTNLLIEQIIEWNFGDTASGANNASTLGLPLHIYSAPGTYPVSCILQVNCGGPVNISNPIGVPCFYIDTIYTTVTITDCDSVIEEDCNLYVPNSFTPNNDGINDVFHPFTACTFEEYECFIYNRWGQLLFKTSDPNEKWNGKYKGQESPLDVYVYLLNYKFPLEKNKMKRGKIALIK